MCIVICNPFPISCAKGLQVEEENSSNKMEWRIDYWMEKGCNHKVTRSEGPWLYKVVLLGLVNSDDIDDKSR